MEELFVHYWQLPEDIYVSLKDGFHQQFCRIIQEKIKYNHKNCFHKILSCPKWHAQRLFTRFIRFTLKELEELSKFAGISHEEIEKNIEAIGRYEDGTIIKSPNLPFNLKDLVYVASHLMFDGSYRDKRGCYFYAYEPSLVEYHKGRLLTFGEVPMNLIKGENQLQFSYAVGYITSKFFNIKTFESTKCYLPEKLKSLAKCNKILADEIVKALIIDESTVEDKIEAELSNKQLVEDLFEVINPYYRLNKITSRTRNIDFKLNEKWKYNSTVWKLSFSASSFQDLQKSISPLPIEYKQKSLDFLYARQTKNWTQRKTGETKKLIVSSLMNNPKTIDELSKELLVKQTTIRAHLKGHPTFKDFLIKLGIVDKIGEKILRRGGYAKADIFGVVNVTKANEFLNK